jgi:hypothetical protein
LNGARFVACGGGAVAIATMAIKSKAAADVRTGHITNYATGDEPYRSTEKRPGSRSKGHVVYPFSSVSRSRQENRGSDDCGGKKIFHDRTPSLRAGALDQVQVPLRRAHTLNVEVAKEFRSNQKLFPRPVAAHITRQIEPQARSHFSALERRADQRLERAKVERRSAASPQRARSPRRVCRGNAIGRWLLDRSASWWLVGMPSYNGGAFKSAVG